MSEVAEGPVKDGRVLQVIGAVVDVEVRCAGEDDDDGRLDVQCLYLCIHPP